MNDYEHQYECFIVGCMLHHKYGKVPTPPIIAFWDIFCEYGDSSHSSSGWDSFRKIKKFLEENQSDYLCLFGYHTCVNLGIITEDSFKITEEQPVAASEESQLAVVVFEKFENTTDNEAVIYGDFDSTVNNFDPTLGDFDPTFGDIVPTFDSSFGAFGSTFGDFVSTSGDLDSTTLEFVGFLTFPFDPGGLGLQFVDWFYH